MQFLKIKTIAHGRVNMAHNKVAKKFVKIFC